MILRLVLIAFILAHALYSTATPTGGYKWKVYKNGGQWRSWKSWHCSSTSPDNCRGPLGFTSSTSDSGGNITSPSDTPDTSVLSGSNSEPTSGVDDSADESSATASASSSGSAEVDGEAQDWLDNHNSVRQQHDASDLEWSEELASFARSWASSCGDGHSGGEYGENIYKGSSASPSDAVTMWAGEVSQYNPSSPEISHFTQVVWKSTTLIGCGIATCGDASVAVCEYDPRGNLLTKEAFDENVQV